MESFDGKILDGEEIVLESVQGELKRIGSADGPKSLEGVFVAPQDTKLGKDQSYRLLLSDGRSAQIRIKRRNGASSMGRMNRFEFVVLGSLG